MNDEWINNSSTAGNRLIWVGIGLGALWWVLESFIHVFLFGDGSLFQQLFRPDQHELWMRSLITILLLIFSVYAQNLITKLKRAEEETKHAYAELNQIFETAADGMTVVDKDFNLLRCNQTYLALAGVSNRKAVGKKCYDVFPGPRCHTPECPLVRIQGGELRIESDVEKQRLDGVTVPCIVTVTPFRAQSGDLIGIIEDYKDITERKQAELNLQKAHDELEQRVQERTAELTKTNERLEQEITERKQRERELFESEQKFRSISSSALDAIIMMDHRGHISFWNEAAQKIFGYSFDEIQNKELHLLLAPEKYRTAYIKGFRHFQKTGTGPAVAKTLEFSALRKDGTEFPIDLSVSALQLQGQWCSVGIIRDITERKKAEEKLRKYREHLEEMIEQRTKDLQKAQEQLIRREKLAVLGQLAGGVSHELRNPIGAIKNAAYFLNMAIEDGEPEVKEALEILEKEVNTSDAIISGMLDFARPKPANRFKVGVNDVVREGLSRVSVPENVEVVNQLNGTPSTILADPDQLSQVFRNLIQNAIQAMPEGGRLVVKTSAGTVEPSEAPSPEWLAVSVTDTGVGIDDETQKKVFDPLFTTKPNGIGLGLSLTKMLIEVHEGTIEVQSEVGKGSTFTVKLPVKD